MSSDSAKIHPAVIAIERYDILLAVWALKYGTGRHKQTPQAV
ncbi:MAG: hypothetical protein C5S49_00785 [Candidatus Methanogaster sp.]|nr:MAG: hypothetical protein C5S49_00785 [ANME-2 cluster archaeon]